MDQAEAISLRAPSRQSMQAAAVHSHCCSLAPQDFPAGCQAVQQPVPTLQGAAAWAQQCHTVTHRLAGPLGAPASSIHTEHGRHLQLLTSRHCGWTKESLDSFQGSLWLFSFSASCKQSQELSQHAFHLAKGSINNLVCLLTTSCITATPGTGSHPNTPSLRKFKFVTYFRSSTPYQPLCLFKVQFCSAH